jgi:hypothetical protein
MPTEPVTSPLMTAVDPIVAAPEIAILGPLMGLLKFVGTLGFVAVRNPTLTADSVTSSGIESVTTVTVVTAPNTEFVMDPVLSPLPNWY